MTDAIETQGVEIKVGDGASPESFTKIAEIVSFDGPGGSAAVIDASSLDSTAREKLMGIADEGQFSFEMNLVPSDTAQTSLRTARDNRDLTSFEVVLTDDSNTTLSFSAFVLEFSISGAVDDKVNANATLEISGQVSWA